MPTRLVTFETVLAFFMIIKLQNLEVQSQLYTYTLYYLEHHVPLEADQGHVVAEVRGAVEGVDIPGEGLVSG